MGKKKGKGGSVVVAVVAAVVTVATAGLAAPVGAAILGAEVAATTIIGSATVGSVVGGAIIGAGIGAASGAAQAALVGEDIAEGAYQGVFVGGASGGLGMLGAGVGAAAAAEVGLDPTLTKAVTEASKGATANATGAAIQDQNVGEWAAMGALSGAATPLATGAATAAGLGDAAKYVGGALGGAAGAGGSAAISGGDVGTAALTGAGMGLAGAIGKPYIEGVMSSLTGGGTTTGATQGAATPVSSGIEGLTPQEISELTTLLSAEVPAAAGAGEQFVEEAYQALFGRPADAEGRAYYAAQIEAGVPREQVLQNMSYGAQGADVSRAAGFDIGTFREGMTPSEYALASVAGDMGGQDVEVVGDYVTGEGPDVEVVDGGYETTSKGGPDVVEDVEANLAEERARAGDEVARGAKEVGDVVREVVTRPLDQQPSKTTVPTFGTGLSKTDREMLSLTGIDGTKGTGGLSDFGFTPTGAGGGGPSTLTGDLVSASYSPDTGAPTFGTSTTFQPTTQSVSGGGPGTGTTTTTPSTFTSPTTKKEKETVRISPIVIDPTVSPLVRALRAAPTPVRSAGLDPATSGVLLGKYGKKDQVWNEATLRLADALGIR